MVTFKEAAEATGYSPDQLRKRLAILGPHLDGAVRRGPRSAILLTEEALAVLRRMAELEREGYGLREAAARAVAQAGPARATVAQPDESAALLRALLALQALETLAVIGLGVALLLRLR